ncbi:MAG TPA: arginine--tRNA ligase, partial [Candidatus Dojkabacteria bacterium]|nr:arginine--tRNA ligase [Candidatus Dojkabacteria bacterium]
MIEIKDRVSKRLIEISKELGIDTDFVSVEIPLDRKYGDLTSNIAMQLSKKMSSNPIELANDIVKRFGKDGDIEKIE